MQTVASMLVVPGLELWVVSQQHTADDPDSV